MTQYLANGLALGAQIGIIGLGFWFVYRTTRALHFAHAAAILAGAYGVLAAVQWTGSPFFLAVVFGVGVGSLVGVLIELCVYAPLRRRGSSRIQIFVASLGLYLITQNTISLAFGDDPQSYYPGFGSAVVVFLGAAVTSVQIIAVLCFVGCFVVAWALLRYTVTCKQLRSE